MFNVIEYQKSLKTINIHKISLIILFYCFNSLNLIKANSPQISVDKISDSKNQQEIVDYEKAVKLHDSGKYLQAEKFFLKSVNAAEEQGKKEILAYSFHYLGRIEEWKSNYYESIYYHEKALRLFDELINIEYIAHTNNNIAGVYQNIGVYDSSLVYYKKNIRNKDNIYPFNSIFISYQNIASLYSKLYNYKLAYRYLQEGIEYVEDNGDKHVLAKIYFSAGKLFLNNHVNKDIALEYFQEAKNLFKETDNVLYVNWVDVCISELYFITENDSLAIQYLKNVINKASRNSYTLLSNAYYMVGRYYKNNSQYDSAMFYMEKSINVMCESCPEILAHRTYIEAANLYMLKGDFEQAYLYLDKARDIAVETESGLEKVRSFVELANYYQAIQEPDNNIMYLIKAHKLALELGLLEKIKKTAELLSNIYYARNEFKVSSDYLKIVNQMNDSLAGIEKYNEIARLEMKFEIERKEEESKLEASRLQSKITKEKLKRNFSISGGAVFIILVIFLFRAYKRKKRDNQLLIKQKAEIQEISKRLQESGKRKLDFFTNVSHEIRTPLTLIKSPLERILKSNKIDKNINNQLQLALNNTNKLKTLVNQILDLQKLDEHNKLKFNLSDFDIVAFCSEIVFSFEGYCYQSNCKLVFESNIDKANIKFDKERLQSILNNLLSNAFKYNKLGGQVHLFLEIKPNSLLVKISDTGKGIENNHLKRIGERYYQVEKSNFEAEGTGIGLAYVKELVELMNGKLEILSTVDIGTTVNLTFPIEKVEIHSETPVNIEIKPKDILFDNLEEHISEDADNELARILIIEDNYELQLFLNDLFAQSYNVFCAKDGLEGKELALKYIPDLIICDIMMPKIKGNELCKILKNDINTSHITIILFTAKGTSESMVDGYDCGADDYIVKPFDSDILVKKVNNIIATIENARKQFSFTDIKRAKTNYSEYDKKFLNDCITTIKKNIGNSNFTVELLADNINIHRRTLLRKFKALTGKSPIDLIKHTRMLYAAKLFKNKNYRVNEVALMVGYEDTNRFSQAFKQFHGISPSSYK